MPTTKRLLTDETGQALVTAINNIVAAVKPNATEIQMSSSDSTSVAQKINNEIATVANGIAIVAEGDVHAAIAEGQFIYVRNHSTLAQGVYKATAAIGTNAALSTTNLTLDNGGGLNDLQAQITSLNSNLATKAIVKKDGIASGSSVTVQITKPAFVVVGRASISTTSTTAFIDSWNGVVYLSKYSELVVSCSGDIVTITNNSGFYGNYIVLY